MKLKFTIIAFLMFTIKNIAIAANILIIPPKANIVDTAISYMEYAVSDIVYKELILFSKNSIILEQDNKFDYQNTKSNIKKILDSYSVDVVITYSVQKYKAGYTLDIFIYSIEKSNGWYEYILYSSEEEFYKSINNFLDTINNYSKKIEKQRSKYKLDIISYQALIVYYNDLLNSSNNKSYDLYKRFLTFHKNNLYFNMDYIIHSIGNSVDEEEYKKTIKELENILSKNHHYINYLYANLYYSRYKKSGLYEDIKNAIEYIEKAIEDNDKNYIYYNIFGDIYLIKNDYQNALTSYKTALLIYSKNVEALNNLIFIYMKDVATYTGDIIEYSNILIEEGVIEEDIIEVLVDIYKNAGDRENELYYLNMHLEYINKEIAHIKANQLGAGPLYKYTLKQKNIEKRIKNIKESIL